MFKNSKRKDFDGIIVSVILAIILAVIFEIYKFYMNPSIFIWQSVALPWHIDYIGYPIFDTCKC